ncbi:hypothetical protein YDYSY3_01250 [Paenibacillus chitinolyticus]|nr:hypothetical protein YDYSY3_01250 [Paenibacillus chitinolyticus]
MPNICKRLLDVDVVVAIVYDIAASACQSGTGGGAIPAAPPPHRREADFPKGDPS